MLIRTVLRMRAEVSKNFRVSLYSHVAICQPALENGKEKGKEGKDAPQAGLPC